MTKTRKHCHTRRFNLDENLETLPYIRLFNLDENIPIHKETLPYIRLFNLDENLKTLPYMRLFNHDEKPENIAIQGDLILTKT